jgi:O-antigen/teichoic acid export membrane protein
MDFIKRILSINRATLYGICAKFVNGGAWLAIALTVSTRLSKPLQGYFFTFLSLATIQMLFDLGIGMAIIQFVAHEWGVLPENIEHAQSSAAASRLASVFRFALYWYFLGAGMLVVILLPAGVYFFYGTPTNIWLGPWVFLCVAVACDFALNAFWNVLEGCNQVSRVYRYRALKAALLGGAVWAALLLGFGIYSLGIGYFVTLPLSVGMLFGENARLLRWIRGCSADIVVAWRKEILPLQWRLAVSFGSGYFAQWGITPITFKLFGPIVAGQFGLVWSMINAVTAIASVMVTVRAPQFGILIAERRFRELDKLALKLSLTSLAFAVFACSVIGTGVYALNVIGSSVAQRVLPLGPTLIMLGATIFWQVGNLLAIYLRSHKKEPYLWLSFGFAISLVCLTFVAGRLFGAWGVTIAYFALVTFFFLPGAVWIFLSRRRVWHAPFPSDELTNRDILAR